MDMYRYYIVYTGDYTSIYKQTKQFFKIDHVLSHKVH